jgi:general secretion pathway protein K
VSSKFPERSSGLRHQHGAALIVALVVVLLVVLLATRVSSDYLVLFRTVENQGELQQARIYLRGAELVAEQALLRDLQAGSDIDSALEPWGRRADLPLPEGVLSACLADLQGRLNLNDLAGPGAAGGMTPASYSPAQRRFVRLLQAVDANLDSIAAATLANAVFDWIDPDDNTRYPGGAEALDYGQGPQPYRPANQPFASVTELRLIKGFSSELVAALTPYVSVWGNGNLNLNTLDAQLSPSADAVNPVMLRTLNTADTLLPLSLDGARLLAAARTNGGGVLQSLDFFNAAPFTAQDWELDGIALTSAWFELTAVMRTAGRSWTMTSVLHRAVSLAGVPQVSVVSRRFDQGATDAAATTGMESASCAVTSP